MIAHPVRWQAPQPLWARFGATVAVAATAADQTRPAILRFASDEFMDHLLAMLAADPRQLGQVIARPETWRSPGGETPDLLERVPLPGIARALARLRKGRAAPTALDPTTDVGAVEEGGVTRPLPLKLYHPAHQRHYLVAANLVCGVAGLPDHALATGGGEQVSFVLRRLLPGSPTAGAPVEYAFVRNGSGARWQRVSPDPSAADPFAKRLDGEEALPLFPLTFRDDATHPRRLFAGIVPVGRREEYMTSRAHREPAIGAGPSATTTGTLTPPTAISERKEQFKLDVAEPWKHLVRAAYATQARMYDGYYTKDPPTDEKRGPAAEQFNEQAQSQSWLILLDFADYLAHHLPNVWDVVQGRAPRTPLTGGQQKLLTWLDGADPVPAVEWITFDKTVFDETKFVASMREALKQVSTQEVRNSLELAGNTFPHALGAGLAWPSFFYFLAGIRKTSAPPGFSVAGKYETLPDLVPDPDDAEATPSTTTAVTKAADLDKLVQLVVGAIDLEQPAASAPPLPFAAQLRDAMKTTQGDAGWFLLRCVYVRADCGPLEPPVLSAPSQHFQLASFFDADAPARPIRIALPIDTTAAGMRKFNKNTAFVISDALCGQLQRAKGLGFGDLVLSVLPWPFHKDLDVGGDGIGRCQSSSGASLGMICSLSIPIITICALILLMMIVLVLDMIFKWIPWFIVCFPLPGFKAKK
jgi:hypothetical protein